MRIDYVCDYCNNQEYIYVYSEHDVVKCSKCGDKKVRHIERPDGDVFGYEKGKDKK